MNALKSIAKYSVLSGLLVVARLVSADTLELPKYSVVDKLGVSITGGTVTTSLNTLAIGGSMGLSHKISTVTNDFIAGPFNGRGVVDKFIGAALYKHVVPGPLISPNYGCNVYGSCPNGVYWMHVNDPDSSADFEVGLDGTYTPIKDKNVNITDSRNSLVRLDVAHLLWTKPDGTQVTFLRNADSPKAFGILQKMVYPNGFTVAVTSYEEFSGQYHRPLSVVTNTGFQLKYNYAEDDTFTGVGAGDTNTSSPPENTLRWSQMNPISVVAINNALEFCDTAQTKLCVAAQDLCPTKMGPNQTCRTFTNKWPTVKFDWPQGMPRAAYIKPQTFTVTHPNNAVTQYFLEPMDLSTDETGAVLPPYKLGQYVAPRLKRVKPATSNSVEYSYSYKNYFDASTGSCTLGCDVSWTLERGGYIDRANGPYGNFLYSKGRYLNQGMQDLAFGGRAYGDLEVATYGELGGVPRDITSDTGYYVFERDLLNRLSFFVPPAGASQSYFYDARGNLVRIKSAIRSTTAIFPVTCTNPKTCNQATQIIDRADKVTSYTYHEPSGQVASITYPANKRGLVAQTRFTYEQKQAQHWISETSGKVLDPNPIWLKTAEKYCINSNFLNGVCAGADEFITTYEYENDNLLLTGKTMTDPKTKKTLRVCYEYDKYGNKLGETKPRANLTSCKLI